MYGFNALENEKREAQKKMHAERQALADEIKSIEELTPGEQELLFRLHLCANFIQWHDLQSEYRTHYDALATKGFIKETEDKYFFSTKPEFKEAS